MVNIDLRGTAVWPKRIPPLTDDQLRMRDLFMARWLEELPSRYGVIERFNHGYAAPATKEDAFGRTLEIGAGLGAHLKYEPGAGSDYYAIDLRPELVDAMHSKYPVVTALVGDIQEGLPFDACFFDRVLGIHVLEHLSDLPRALDEVYRVLSPRGTLKVVIPCEGGVAYSFARRISAQRMFEREFQTSYRWLIRSEHVNVPWEIFGELRKRFELVDATYFPLRLPVVALNLAIGLTLTKL